MYTSSIKTGVATIISLIILLLLCVILLRLFLCCLVQHHAFLKFLLASEHEIFKHSSLTCSMIFILTVCCAHRRDRHWFDQWFCTSLTEEQNKKCSNLSWRGLAAEPTVTAFAGSPAQLTKPHAELFWCFYNPPNWHGLHDLFTCIITVIIKIIYCNTHRGPWLIL